jgi:hypothetical protein
MTRLAAGASSGRNDRPCWIRQVPPRRPTYSLAFHAVVLIGWGVILVIRGGGSLTFALVLLAGLLLVEHGVVYLFRFVAGYRELRRRAAGRAPTWPAGLVAVLQAWEAGFAIPSGVCNDSSLRGRLTLDGDRWSWTAKPTRTRPEITTIVLPADWSPTLHHKLGYRHILTFTDQGGARLDFGIGLCRDLLRHLQGHHH